jgi:rubrerythrin
MEKSAREFYLSAVDRVGHAGAQQMLRELAAEEDRHIQLFEDALAGKDVVFGEGAPEAGQDLQLGETMEAPKLSASSEPADVLLVAIKAEMRAIQFYSQSASTFAGTGTEQMLLGLVKEEQAHKARLERLLDDEFFKDN